jgi:hypothetical protein
VQTFTALAERDGTGWTAQVVGDLDIHCRGRRLDRLLTAVTANIAAAADLEEAEIEVIMKIENDPLVRDVIQDFQHYQMALAEAQMEYNGALRRAVLRLASERISDRDASFLLGLSHQRIAQVRVAS